MPSEGASASGRPKEGEPLLPLPPCNGPKLHAFAHQNAPIEWLGRLDEDQPHTQGHVFKVRIESQIYALKVVSRSTYSRMTKGSVELTKNVLLVQIL